MENMLTNKTKTRLIWELRQILYSHPKYRKDSDNVQNKFAFPKERPQRGIIVNNASADRVRLSADNYVGRLSSFVMQAPVENHPGTSVEWVVENKSLLERYSARRDIFPSPPGAYVITIQSVPDEGHGVPGQFIIDPYLTASNEELIIFSSPSETEAQVSREGIYPNSMRLWLDGRRPLLAGVDFTVDYASGLITFLKSTPVGSSVMADYRYRLGQQGPYPFNIDQADYRSIPGAILAFGDRAQEGDRLAVVVGETRSDVAEVYGGKFEVGFELIVFARDPEERERMSDYVVAKILERQNQLGYDGLELLDVSPGGETEEVYNQEVDDYYYDGNVSVSYRVDWEVHSPLPVEIFRAEVTSKAEELEKGYLDGTYTADMLNAKAARGELLGVPAIIGRSPGYERIR